MTVAAPVEHYRYEQCFSIAMVEDYGAAELERYAGALCSKRVREDGRKLVGDWEFIWLDPTATRLRHLPFEHYPRDAHTLIAHARTYTTT